MASGIVVNLQQEVTCPICLELLTEPLSLDCGHSFCQACITANNMVSMNDQDEDRRCPVCRISYEPGNLRPNRHVANIVQRLREVKLSPEVEQERNLCLRHGEKLMLFCEEDREVICWLCARSQEHHGHHTFLMEDVAQDYQVRERNGGKTDHKVLLEGKSPLCIGLCLPGHHGLEACDLFSSYAHVLMCEGCFCEFPRLQSNDPTHRLLVRNRWRSDAQRSSHDDFKQEGNEDTGWIEVCGFPAAGSGFSRTKRTSLLWKENADSYLLSLKNTFPSSDFLPGHRF